MDFYLDDHNELPGTPDKVVKETHTHH